MGRNLFRKPFDDGTIDKLKIFEDYFKEWLPVFIAKPDSFWKEIQIFDFFAGQGKDANGVFGSPMIIISTLNKNKELILKSGVKIKVILNEVEEYFDLMKSSVDNVIDNSIYEVHYYNEDFSNVFAKYYDSMSQAVNFLFLDQNGIKQITDQVFKQIIELKRTDFIFFISSSYINRFGDSESFQKYLKITKQDLLGKSYYHVHRIVLEYYRSRIPVDKDYYLAPFSIKKPSGVYGLIFGTNHVYGLEKFLKVCWRHDKLTGEANFDIDNEKIDLQRPSLFEQYNVPKKIQLFELNLRVGIIRGDLSTDRDVYLYTLEEGFLPKHANEVLKSMKTDGSIKFDFILISEKIHKLVIPSPIKK